MKYKIKIVILLILIILPIILGNYAPNSPFKVNINDKFAGISEVYLLGADNLGRCELSRILYAGDLTIRLVIVASIIIGILGTVFGLLLSIKDGFLKMVIMSFIDAITTIPTIVYLMIFVGVLENRLATVIIGLVFSITLRLTKYVMTLSEDEQKKAYVICAKCLGASDIRMVFVHILPNIKYRIFSYISLSCAEMVMMISAFSFIGINLGDTKIDWGLLLSEGKQYLYLKPSLTIYPMVLIIFYTYIFNILSSTMKEKKE